MTRSLEAAKAKLAAANPPFPLEDLPVNPDDNLWNKIETVYQLTLSELAALKNFKALRNCCISLIRYRLPVHFFFLQFALSLSLSPSASYSCKKKRNEHLRVNSHTTPIPTRTHT